MYIAPFSESVLAVNVDSRTDMFLSLILITFSTALSVNVQPEIMDCLLSIVWITSRSMVLDVNIESSMSRLEFPLAWITFAPSVLLINAELMRTFPQPITSMIFSANLFSTNSVDMIFTESAFLIKIMFPGLFVLFSNVDSLIMTLLDLRLL